MTVLTSNIGLCQAGLRLGGAYQSLWALEVARTAVMPKLPFELLRPLRVLPGPSRPLGIMLPAYRRKVLPYVFKQARHTMTHWRCGVRSLAIRPAAPVALAEHDGVPPLEQELPRGDFR